MIKRPRTATQQATKLGNINGGLVLDKETDDDDGGQVITGADLPGCDIEPASPAVGAVVPLTYFGAEPSSVNPSFVGSLQLLQSGELEVEEQTITIPLYRGEMQGQGRGNVWYVVTDTTDQGNAEALGLNHSPKLVYSAVGNAVRNATLMGGGVLRFERGTVDFSPVREVVAAAEPNPFPPAVANPGSIGDRFYTPLVRINNAGGHIYNAPMIAFGSTAEEINCPNGGCDYSLVHDSVVAIDVDNMIVTLELVPGFSFAKPVLYLSLDASAETPAALEGANFAPALADIHSVLGFDDTLFGPMERLFGFVNGPRGCDNPQRQGFEAAVTDGNTPFNVLGGIPTVATDYSPLWDVNLGEWTQESIDNGYRSRLIEEFQILTFVDNGFITGPGGAPYGSSGFIVNCPIVFRFL